MNEIIKLAEEKLSSQLHTLSNMQQGREEVIESLVMSQKEIENKQSQIKSLKKEIRILYSKFPEYAKDQDTQAPQMAKPSSPVKAPTPFYGGKKKPNSDEDFD